MDTILKKVIMIALDAGDVILKYYNNEIKYISKDDQSPLTQADLESNNLIKRRLKLINNNYNILSEEHKNEEWKIRRNWKSFWLVDPLDGTKEFINKNGEFTVNIAMLENNYPILGVIYAPYLKTLYYGVESRGSYKITNINNYDDFKLFNESDKIFCRQKIDKFKIIASRSHHSVLLDEWLANFKNYEISDAGSSLKFCLLAEGKADVYPRFVGSSEWDIAAGEIILKEAGGIVLDLDDNHLLYNKETLRNKYFIASSKQYLKAI